MRFSIYIISLLHQAVGQLSPVEKNDVAVLRAMVAAQKLLLEELQNLSNAIECTIDFSDFASEVDGTNPFSSPEDSSVVDNQAFGQSKPQNSVEVLKLLSKSTLLLYLLKSLFLILHIFVLLLNRKKTVIWSSRMMGCYTHYQGMPCCIISTCWATKYCTYGVHS